MKNNPIFIDFTIAFWWNGRSMNTWFGDTKNGFSYRVGPPKLPPNILIGFKQNRGPTYTQVYSVLKLPSQVFYKAHNLRSKSLQTSIRVSILSKPFIWYLHYKTQKVSINIISNNLPIRELQHNNPKTQIQHSIRERYI